MVNALYKAKRADNGKWVEGFYICIGTKFHYIYSGKLNLLSNNLEERYRIIPETAGQYTGLSDTNKKKIFGGDVVKCRDESEGIEFIAVVEFGNPNGEYSWGWQLRHLKGDKPNLDILCWIDMEETGTTCEVIGNIFDEKGE